MPYPKEAFLASNAERARAQTQNMLPLLRMVQAAGPVMAELVTNNGNWDRYLSYLQGLVDQQMRIRDAARDRLSAPDEWDGQALAKLKSSILVSEAMISAWQAAMELPKAIIENSSGVDDIIRRFDAKNEATGQPKS